MARGTREVGGRRERAAEAHEEDSTDFKEPTHGQVKILVEDAKRVEHTRDHSVVQYVNGATG